MAAAAAQRQLSDLTIGPVLTWTTEAILAHTNKLLQIPGGAVDGRVGGLGVWVGVQRGATVLPCAWASCSKDRGVHSCPSS